MGRQLPNCAESCLESVTTGLSLEGKPSGLRTKTAHAHAHNRRDEKGDGHRVYDPLPRSLSYAVRHERIDNDDGNSAFPTESNYDTSCLTFWWKQGNSGSELTPENQAQLHTVRTSVNSVESGKKQFITWKSRFIHFSWMNTSHLGNRTFTARGGTLPGALAQMTEALRLPPATPVPCSPASDGAAAVNEPSAQQHSIASHLRSASTHGQNRPLLYPLSTRQLSQTSG
ncbi:hypothetical protein MG293_010914 [Ovis ammon polii]|uniref:Uncharacterized protein n=1 Tax=Ovis ammon polii TaxID=230172 RepID=A0AAD4Y922_OVIAM|nr:hypothetical protein MG293_010914 [Ovis ammon polii]